jgi:hypothetical protein
MAALHKAVTAGYPTTWALTERDPAFDTLRSEAEFRNLMLSIKAKQAHERQILARMRADGRVPDRSGPARAGAAAAKLSSVAH